MKNITQFLLMLTLSFYIAFAPAVAYADPVTDKIEKLQIDLQKRVGDKWTLSPRNSVGAGVEIGVSQSYPVTATTTATTAAGATITNTATLTAQKVGSKIFTPTNANIAKRFAGGVAQGLVAMVVYDLVKSAVDYVMDPENNTVRWKIPAQSGYGYSLDDPTKYGYTDTPEQVCDMWNAKGLNNDWAGKYYYAPGGSYGVCKGENSGSWYIYRYQVSTSEQTVTKTFDEIAGHAIGMAAAGNTQAQDGMQAVVGDMITNNEIDNSYFNDADISNDTYNDVTNNYITNNITNQYPGVQVPTQSELAQAAQNGQTSVTKSHTNGDGSVTTTTTNFTTNNTTTNNTTTNNTYNITNITTNNLSKYDGPGSDKPDTPASTTAPSSAPASTPQPTEFPEFCEWAKPVCDFIDWVKEEPKDSDNDVSVNQQPIPSIDTDISFGGSCPANVEIQFGLPGHTVPLTVMDWAKFCMLMDKYLKPIVIAIASYQAIRILGGQRESG